MCDTMGLSERAEFADVAVPVLQLSVEQHFIHVVILPNVAQPVMEHVS